MKRAWRTFLVLAIGGCFGWIVSIPVRNPDEGYGRLLMAHYWEYAVATTGIIGALLLLTGTGRDTGRP